MDNLTAKNGVTADHGLTYPPKNYMVAAESWGDFWKSHKEELEEMLGLEQRLTYVFSDRRFLYEALSHRSAIVDYQVKGRRQSAGKSGQDLCWNERMEFLGDSVLSLVITNYIWNRRENLTEGGLSRLRASLVNEEVLADIARTIELGICIAIGRGEEQAQGRLRDSLLADTLEAVIGAVYLDGGFATATRIVEHIFRDLLEGDWGLLGNDHKTQLQELIQDSHKEAPTYELIRSQGPDHARVFEVGVVVLGKTISVGRGVSKKKASQEAARLGLIALAGLNKS